MSWWMAGQTCEKCIVHVSEWTERQKNEPIPRVKDKWMDGWMVDKPGFKDW
jgi:hypothetical protein